MSTPHQGSSDVPSDEHDRMPEVIRSEEELVVTRRAVESGRVRLVKRIVTETRTKTVEVRREELHIERLPPGDTDASAPNVEPRGRSSRTPRDRLPARLRGGLSALQRRSRDRAGRAVAPGPFADEEMEIVLIEEEVLVTKRAVPRERVRLRRETVVEQREIADSLRKEQVELIEGPTATRSTHPNTEREDR